MRLKQNMERKKITSEPNKVGEYAPIMGTQSTGWDSLKNVPFMRNQNAFKKATTGLCWTTRIQSHSNAFAKATSAISVAHGSSYTNLLNRCI